MLRTQHIDENLYQKPDWLAELGDYNSWPSPRREIDLHRFLHITATKSPSFMDTRQIILDRDKPFCQLAVTILFFHDCAVAFVCPQAWKSTATGIEYDLSECRFFEIGCDHKYRELSQAECRERGIPHSGACWHVQECKSCGYMHAYDSSG